MAAGVGAPGAEVGGRGAGGAGVGTITLGAAAAGDAGAPPAGKVGNLIVAVDAGFGGRLMRTVSFLGWTLEASAGLGGRLGPGGGGGGVPPGPMGGFSAINMSFSSAETRTGPFECQTRSQFRSRFTLLSSPKPS